MVSSQLSKVIVVQISSNRMPSSIRASSGSFSGIAWVVSFGFSRNCCKMKGCSTSMPETARVCTKKWMAFFVQDLRSQGVRLYWSMEDARFMASLMRSSGSICLRSSKYTSKLIVRPPSSAGCEKFSGASWRQRSRLSLDSRSTRGWTSGRVLQIVSISMGTDSSRGGT